MTIGRFEAALAASAGSLGEVTEGKPTSGPILIVRCVIFALILLLYGIMLPPRAEASISSCSIGSAVITFSSYDTVAKAQVDAIGSITISCTGRGNTHNFVINATGGNTNSCTSRSMKRTAGTATLNYQVYRNSTRTNEWCDTTKALTFSFSFGFSGSTETVTIPVYGRIVATQNPSAAGPYTDTLSITVRESGGATYATGTFLVNGNVLGTCSISTTNLAFGTYTAVVLDGTATVTVNCTNSTTYAVSLSAGQNLSGGTRRLAGPLGSYLTYQLFQDSGRTTAWADGTALGAKKSGVANGAAQALSVYGRIPANQLVRAGSYADVVVATVEY
jgi:spore coat protein U-like protein